MAKRPDGIPVNGSVEALPSWLQIVTPEASFNLTADVLHYFEVGVKLVSAPLGNFRITVGETIGETNFMAYVSYGIPPTPYLNPELHQRLVDYLRNRMQGVTTRFRWIGA